MAVVELVVLDRVEHALVLNSLVSKTGNSAGRTKPSLRATRSWLLLPGALVGRPCQALGSSHAPGLGWVVCPLVGHASLGVPTPAFSIGLVGAPADKDLPLGRLAGALRQGGRGLRRGLREGAEVERKAVLQEGRRASGVYLESLLAVQGHKAVPL